MDINSAQIFTFHVSRTVEYTVYGKLQYFMLMSAANLRIILSVIAKLLFVQPIELAELWTADNRQREPFMESWWWTFFL